MNPRRFCIILGAMKCGTSSLFKALRVHPQILPSRYKEPGFFSFEDLYAQGLGAYYRLWIIPWWLYGIRGLRKRYGEPVCMEASTHYTKEPDIPSGAHRLTRHVNEMGEVRLIYVVRDPFRRIESQYNFDFQRGRLRDSEGPMYDAHMLNVTKYMMQLRPYLENFSNQSLLVLDFDRLVGDTPKVLREIAAFLDIDTDFAFGSLPRSNEGKERVSRYEHLKNIDAYNGTHDFRSPLRRFRSRHLRNEFIARRKLTDQEKGEIFEDLREDIAAFHDYFGWYPANAENRPLIEQAHADAAKS